MPRFGATRRSPFRLIVGVLVLFARLLGPGLPAQAAAITLDDVAFCHAGGGDVQPHGQDPQAPAKHQHDCLACSVCNAAAQVAVVAMGAVLVGPGPVALPATRDAADLATGPPSAVRAATPPTGPPATSV